jgi:hypothetical protein
MTVNGTAIGQLEETLPHFLHRTVNFVKEQDNTFLASLLKPIGGIPSGTITVNNGQTNKVTLSHLRGTTLNNPLANLLGKGINRFRLADTVLTPNHNRVTGISNRPNDRTKRLKVHTHLPLRLPLHAA